MSRSRIAEGEVQSLLGDAKKRCEEHKNNYRLVKGENMKLQEEYISLQSQMRQVLDECNLSKENTLKAVESARKTIDQKDLEIHKLRSLLEENSAETIQQSLLNNFRTLGAEKEGEIEKLKSEIHQLKYENAMIRSQIETQASAHTRTVHEQLLKHQMELKTLSEIKESKIKSQLSVLMDDSDSKNSAMQKENSSMLNKIKSLGVEIEGLHAEREMIKLDYEGQIKILAKQITQYTTENRVLESDKSSLASQLEIVKKEIHSCQVKEMAARKELQSLKSLHLTLKNNHQNLELKCRSEMAEARVIFAREKKDLEREIQNLTEHLNRQDEQQSKAVEDIQMHIMAKEKLTVEIQNLKRASQENHIALESEIVELKHKLSSTLTSNEELEQRLLDKTAQLALRNKETRDEQSSMEKEAKHLKSFLVKLSASQDNEIHLTQENQALHEELSKCQMNVHQMDNKFKELVNKLQYSEKSIQKYTQEIKNTKDTTKEEHALWETEKLEREASHIEQMGEMAKRVTLLEATLREIHQRHRQEVEDWQRKCKHHLITNEEAKSQLTELQKQNTVLRLNIPAAVHEKTVQHLNELKRKHLEYQFLISTMQLQSSSNPAHLVFNSTRIQGKDNSYDL